jgi:phosphatidylinositol glycan class B
MKNLIRTPYSKLIFIALLIHIATAYFSEGFHHPDEHFQILEFSNYKLGNTPESDLPWEFEARIRPALQPFITNYLVKLLSWTGIKNPFTLAFILRLITGIITWYIISKFCLLFLPSFKSNRAGNIFILCSLLLWFVPFFNVRFSSETLSGTVFLFGLYPILNLQHSNYKKELLQLSISGFLFGLSFFFRFQMGFAILGLGIWLLIIRKLRWSKLAVLLFAGIASLTVCTLIDYWFYGERVLTPVNYFDVNIIQNKAADWGVSPWWYYFTLFFNKAAPPISLVLLVLFFIGIFSKPKHVFTFIFIPFLLGHMLIGHKEMRFLVPLTFPFIFLACQGAEYLSHRLKARKVWNYLLALLLLMNFSLLIFRGFSPASEPIKYYKYLYRQSKQSNITLISGGDSIYHLADLDINFYRPENIELLVFGTDDELSSFLEGTNSESVFYFSKDLAPGKTLHGFDYQKVYCYYPEWILRFNINNWQNRVKIWSIYRVKK